MTDTESTAQKAVRLIPCAYCGAVPGKPCRTSSGAPAGEPHGLRTAPLYDAWREGYAYGRADLAESAARLIADHQPPWRAAVQRLLDRAREGAL